MESINRPSNVVYDSDRHFAEELRMQIQVLDKRKNTGNSLTANEMLVQIPIERFDMICRLALEALQNRHKE